jgi:hypothetical protein
MELTDFTLKIIFLCIPGITCYFILSRLIGKFNKDTVEIILIIFVFSVFSYLVYGFYCAFVNIFYGYGFKTNIVESFFKNNSQLTYLDILGSSITSIFLAFIFSYFYRFNLLNKFGQIIRTTNKYGDEDVWHYFHNSPDTDKNGGWIIVRDHKYNLAYYGFVSAWSDSAKMRELIISDVTVFTNDDSQELYKTNHIYICRKIEEISMEIPLVEK